MRCDNRCSQMWDRIIWIPRGESELWVSMWINWNWHCSAWNWKCMCVRDSQRKTYTKKWEYYWKNTYRLIVENNRSIEQQQRERTAFHHKGETKIYIFLPFRFYSIWRSLIQNGFFFFGRSLSRGLIQFGLLMNEMRSFGVSKLHAKIFKQKNEQMHILVSVDSTDFTYISFLFFITMIVDTLRRVQTRFFQVYNMRYVHNDFENYRRSKLRIRMNERVFKCLVHECRESTIHRFLNTNRSWDNWFP